MRTRLILAGVMLAIGASAFAGGPVSERRTIFKNYKHTLSAMNKMIGGSYDKAQFAKLAHELDAQSKQPWQYFPAGSSTADTKGAIWSKPGEFKQAATDFQQNAAKLSQAADSGDLAQVRAQFRMVQKSCKTCHDQFRS